MGARLRVSNIGRILAGLGAVTLFVCEEERAGEQPCLPLHAPYASVERVHLRHRRERSFLNRLRHELDAGYLNTHGLSISAAARAELLPRLEHFDLTWVHTLRTANALGIRRWPAGVLDVDDLYSGLYRSMAGADDDPVRRFLHLRMAHIWRVREHRLPSRFRRLVVCSESDRKALGSLAITHVVRNGYSLSVPRADAALRDSQRLGFVGLLTYAPNRDGLAWYIRTVWPVVKRLAPAARLRVVGQGGDQALSALGRDIDVLGYVEDLGAEMESWAASVVPVRFGAGTRVKIAEAFARCCPVVSTTLGAAGYEVTDGCELLLADTPEAFAFACLRLLEQPALRRTLAHNGWQRFQAEWSWGAIARSVEAVVEATLRASRGRVPVDQPPMATTSY
jgi:glycosyltransferase involved in cell wall biosynthesis